MRPSRKFAVIGRLDDLARRLRHQAAHGGELADLLGGTSGAGVGHDVDRVEARLDELLARLGIDDLLLADLVHHLLRDLVGDAGPDVDDLVVALAVGDEPFLVLVDDALHFGLRLAEEHALRLRDDHVVHADGDAGARGVVEAERAQAVGQEDGRLVAVLAVAGVDERRRAPSCRASC